jgi:lipopolysaccharide export system protein LptA
MWTPRRIGLLLIGIAMFGTSYAGYARCHLGTIDGLPTLPEELRRPVDSNRHIESPPPRTSRVEAKLRQAFGEECQELKHPIKLELNSKSMVLAAGMAKFDEDGRVYLEPVSVALFGKNQNDGKGVEINTIKGDRAWLTFDRPVFTAQDMNGRKVTGAELVGNIDIVNNRRTPERTDDLVLHINHGPVYYKESTHLIWTEDRISVLDQQSTPKPTQVRGKGMEVELLTEAPAKPGAPARKAKQENISGVKRITIPADVEMYLYVEPNRSGMPGGDREPAKSDDKAPKPAPAKPAVEEEKAEIIIRTPGRFRYDFNKDHDLATFDVPAVDPKHPARSPEDVTVVRHMPKLNTDDHLFCKHLELRLRRKESAPAAKPGQPKSAAPAGKAPEQGLEIERAVATGGPKEVVITSDTEKLSAEGDEFIHDARQQLTILRGKPEMQADREGSIIRAPELCIQELPVPDGVKGPNGKVRTYQQVTAKGPGVVHMYDRDKKKAEDHASWTETLTSARDADTKAWCPDGPLDLLVLTGSARFWNDEQGSSLQGDTLKVWVMPREPEGDPAAKSQPASQPAPRPRRVDAIGHVFSNSRELIIHDTSRLKIIFKDAPPGALPPAAPNTSMPPTDRAAPAAPRATGDSARAVPQDTKPADPSARRLPDGSPPPRSDPKAPATTEEPRPAQPPKTEAVKAEEEPRPMYLSARTIDATVLRAENKNLGDKKDAAQNRLPGSNGPGTKDILEKLWCEGRVHVRQAGDPTKPEDKGVDIKGSTLDLTWRPEGNLLIVSADDKASQPNENWDDLAQMLVNNLYIIGPEIAVDQKDNTVAVEGSGAMMMESATTVAGTVKKEPVPLTIHWTKSMLFTGKSAMFQGEIQAEQENSRMACEALTVFFDRAISLKEGGKATNGEKGEKPPRVETMVCDRKVLIEEATPETDPKTGKPVIEAKTGRPKLGSYKRISAPTVEVETSEKAAADLKDANKLRASGPGKVWLFQRGADPLASADPPGSKPATKPAKKPDDEDEMKLTYVEYGKSMLGNSQTGKINFWGGVRALNMPGDDPSAEIDLDAMLAQFQLPKGATYLTSDQLEVIGEKGPDGKTYQKMTATRRVWVKANEYEASCDTLHFDESKDSIAFYGNENGMATLTRRLKKGGPEEAFKGKVIIYQRSTGNIKADGVDYLGNTGG